MFLALAMSWVGCTGDQSTTDTTSDPGSTDVGSTDTEPDDTGPITSTADTGGSTPVATADVRITNYLVHRSADHWGTGASRGLGEVEVRIDGKVVGTMDYCDDLDLTLAEGKRAVEVRDAQSGEVLSSGLLPVPLPPRSDGETGLPNVFGLRSPTLAIRNDGRNATVIEVEVSHDGGSDHDVSVVAGPLAIGIDVPAGSITYETSLDGTPASSGSATLQGVNVMLCTSSDGEIRFIDMPNCAAINRLEECDGELDFVPPSMVVP
ncbi:MAG: hypothetical protein KTR31_03620 [Myxococcales bacterium]|nr:hypothetical protein [Myxococcales bacterium]